MASFVRLAIYGATTLAIAIAVPQYTGLTVKDAQDMTKQVKTSVAAAHSAVVAIGGEGAAPAAPSHGVIPAKYRPTPTVHTSDPNADEHARASLAHLEKVIAKKAQKLPRDKH